MKEEDMSVSWKKLAIELDQKCAEKKIDFYELRDWITDSIEHIQREEFDYHISVGQIPDYPTQKIDVNILLGKFLYGFTVMSTEKQFTMTLCKVIDRSVILC